MGECIKWTLVDFYLNFIWESFNSMREVENVIIENLVRDCMLLNLNFDLIEIRLNSKDEPCILKIWKHTILKQKGTAFVKKILIVTNPTQPNITKVGFDTKMTLHHHTHHHTNPMPAVSQLLVNKNNKTINAVLDSKISYPAR